MGAVLPRQADGGIDALPAALAVVEMHKQVFVGHHRPPFGYVSGCSQRAASVIFLELIGIGGFIPARDTAVLLELGKSGGYHVVLLDRRR